jgi:phosphopantothenoylcysteine decarboxylase/phosphopantothenate--cysteine ligase
MARRRRLRFVVSAGPTREHLDAVRFLSSPSSGRMGFAVAEAARARGHRVVLVTGPVSLPAPRGVRVVSVVSAREMRRAVLAAFREADALVMTASVSDYRPARRLPGKPPKDARRLVLPLALNPDILAEAGRRKGHRTCVGFAVEAASSVRNGMAKVRRKRLDALCLCGPAAFEAAAADYRILFPDREMERWPGVRKRDLAKRIVELIEERQ